MFAFFVLATLRQEEPPIERTPSIYRCPAIEAESKFFAPLVHDLGFDTYCIEPKPGASARKIVSAAKLKFLPSSSIDTKANLAWRNLTLDFVNGKISPKAWVDGTKNLKETVHFLSSPKTKKLREATQSNSHLAVFSEMLLLAWPGKPCLTADDIGKTRYLPDPGPLESWVLAMNDWLGPMLYTRAMAPYLTVGKPTILRADAKPGLLIFRQGNAKSSYTFYINNSKNAIEAPDLNVDATTITLGLDLDGPKPRLMDHAFVITTTGDGP